MSSRNQIFSPKREMEFQTVSFKLSLGDKTCDNTVAGRFYVALLVDHRDLFIKSVDFITFYPTCFFIVAMALERWLLVCRPSSAQSILSGRRGSLIRIGLPFLSILLAVYLVADLLRFQMFEKQQFTTFSPNGG